MTASSASAPVTTPPAVPTSGAPVPATAAVKPAEDVIKTDGLFTTAASGTYYYVISVGTLEMSLSSSRFGIGQFNRGNYTGSNLKHNLFNLDQDQIIYVGDFNNINEAHTYANIIQPQLVKIMKVPATLYRSFYISKENLEKIKDRTTLNRYIEFFKANY